MKWLNNSNMHDFPGIGILFGRPDEWQAFSKRQSLFIKKLEPLLSTREKVFSKQVQLDPLVNKVIFFLGCICCYEDFQEILLLAGNGYSIGALKLVRGMYERAVTLMYIHKNPEKAEEFIEYYEFQIGRMFDEGKDCQKNIISDEDIKEIDAAYKNVKSKFQTVDCKKCGTKKAQLSWSKLDLRSMSDKVGLINLYGPCYLETTYLLHCTPYNLKKRIETDEADGNYFHFNGNPKPESSDIALFYAYQLILAILHKVNEHFAMGLENDIDKCFADLNEYMENTWPRR